MRVLVTGGSGAMGGYVLRNLLHAGNSVASFSRSSPWVAGVEGVEHVQGNVLDLPSLQSAYQGYHAIVPSHSWRRGDFDDWTHNNSRPTI